MSFSAKALFFAFILSLFVLTAHSSYGYLVNSSREQIAKGVLPENVVCKDGFVLIKKESENSVACVKAVSVHKLVPRGWILKSQSIITLKEGMRKPPLFVQKIFNDRVTGIEDVSQPIPLPNDSGSGSPITLHFGDSVGRACMEKILILILIENNTATFLEDGTSYYCPVCLSGNTVINTPNGAVNVKELKIGMSVWTVDELGHKQSAIIMKTSKVPVSSTHNMVHIILDDNRELFASPRHPTADDRFIGNLSLGDMLDNSPVKSIQLVSYDENYTYDILPSGQTGFYWANGILVGSTLK